MGNRSACLNQLQLAILRQATAMEKAAVEAQGPAGRGLLLHLSSAQLRPNPLNQVPLAILPLATALEQAVVEDHVQARECRRMDGLPGTSGRKCGAKVAREAQQSTRPR